MYSCEELRERLCDMGYETDENEEDLLVRAMERAEQAIMNNCNCESVPSQLKYVALDMAAGEYLLAAKCQGDGDSGVKSVSEGDVSVTFGDKTPVEVTVDEIFARCRDEMLAYRRIKW